MKLGHDSYRTQAVRNDDRSPNVSWAAGEGPCEFLIKGRYWGIKTRQSLLEALGLV